MTRKILLQTSLGLSLLIMAAGQVVLPAEPRMSEELTFECSPDTTADSQFFKDIQDEARRINQTYCDRLSSKVPANQADLDEIARRLPAFGELVHKTILEKITPSELGNLRKQAEIFRNTLTSEADNPSKMPSMHFGRKSSITGGVERSYFFGSDSTDAQWINRNNNSACNGLDQRAPMCDDYLNDLADAINPYQQNANAFNVYKTRVQLSGLSEEWDRYFDTARYQNSAGIALTTFFENDHFAQDHLVGPPARQWHALQPSLVIENVSEAADGENIEYAVSIEWIGVNWWRDSILGVPFGISLVSVLADRPGVKDVGHGIMLHFDNKYTLGITDHDGDEGVFITLDVLKLFQDKKQQLNSYQQEVKELL